MLRNYLITAIRNLTKNRTYALINIIGLALGIGCSLVIFKVIQFENSYDKHQERYENIYRISNESIYPDRVDKGMGTPHPVGPALIEDYPDIEQVTRTYYQEEAQINIKKPNGDIQKFLLDEGIVFTENSFFKIFTTEWLAGNKETALSEPNTVVLSLSAAKKLFGLENGHEVEAMGKIVDLRGDFQSHRNHS
ncbi:ABC transporter permease [Reichenbachiella agarivorans]|uniref:ABC transporter permease n=1 Tax=Reichenbachiella agarivorans TaxID=2979464 RepID=A0ABY6CM94_9BACT|nr:ABC transporter permease [Reichenbachiella agarivorans]UXP31195.1 ABC transporter permease [Reichenbachiella agarivorans]